MSKDISEDLHIVLTDGEKAHPVWQKLLRHLQAQKEKCRTANDNPQLDAIGTAAMRGRIAVYTALMALNDDQIPQDQE